MFTDDLYPHIEELEAHFSQARRLGTGHLIARAHHARSLAFWHGLAAFRGWLGRATTRARVAHYGALNQSAAKALRPI